MKRAPLIAIAFLVACGAPITNADLLDGQSAPRYFDCVTDPLIAARTCGVFAESGRIYYEIVPLSAL